MASGETVHSERTQLMKTVNFIKTAAHARPPQSVGRGWYLFPCFAGDHVLVRPGEDVVLDSGVRASLAEDEVLSVEECCAVEGMLLHPRSFADGDEIALRFTNASKNVCVIVKEGFDIASRLGHGVYRDATVVDDGRAMARVTLLRTVPRGH